MATLVKHQIYNSGTWSSWSYLQTGRSALGPWNGNSKIRSVFQINLDDLSSGYRRNSLTVDLELATSGQGYPGLNNGEMDGNDSIRYYLTSSAGSKESGSAVIGTIYDSGNSSSFDPDKNGSTRIVTLNIDTSKVTSTEGNVYLWIYSNSDAKDASVTQGYATYTTTSISFSEGDHNKYYTKVTTPSDFTVETKDLLKPTETIKFSWNTTLSSAGTNNEISGYYVYLRYGGKPTDSTYNERVEITHEENSILEYSFTLAGTNQRKKEVYIGIQTLGSKSGYDGDIVSKKVGKINNPPGNPTVNSKSSNKLTPSSSITFNVTKGSDDDGQELTLFYTFDGINFGKFTDILQITTSTDDGGKINNGLNTIYFYTYDGLEYSSPASETFEAIFKPVIDNSITKIDNKYVLNMEGNEDTLVAESKISFGLSSGSVSQIALYIRSSSTQSFLLEDEGQEISKDLYTYNSAEKVINILTSNIESYVAESYYYQFALKVYDGTTWSDMSNWIDNQVSRRPAVPVLPTFNSIANDGLTSEAKSNYYKNKVKITFTNPSSSATRAKVTSIVIVASYGGTKEYACSTTAGQKTLELDLSQVNGNATTTFKFKITDAAGQTKISEAAFATMTKSSALAFGGNVINVSNDNLKPNTNTADFDIAHPFAQASGTNNIIYSYEMQIGSTKAIIAEYSAINIDDPTQKTIRVAAVKINTYALTLVTNYNLIYDTTIRVRATDGFGSVIELTKTIKIDFTEPPVFVTNTFDIKHDYLTGTSTISTSTGTKITSTSTLNVRMVNFGEGIIFVLPKATDPNNDIAEYRIFLSRNDFYDESSVLKYNEVTFGQTPWLTIPYTALEKGTKDSNYYYYLFKASQYTKNEYFYFKLQARDETGNTSREIICENYIIGCRTVAPTFSVGNIRVDRNGEDVTLNYNFLVTDLGGSATKEGWDRDFYNNYPNFERTITGYTPQASLVIEIAPDQNFRVSEIVSNINNPIIFTPTGGKSQADFTSKTISFSGFGTQELRPKIFMRFTLTVSYGLKSKDNTPNFTHSSTIDPNTLPGYNFVFDPSEIIINGDSLNVGDWIVTPTGKIYVIAFIEDYGIEATYNENLNLSSGNRATISSTPQVYTFFGSVPTVAHRAHKVGINTTTIDQDDVLVVENYQGTKYVRFKGTDASNASKTYEITFDLLTGSITGAVIDCGSW